MAMINVRRHRTEGGGCPYPGAATVGHITVRGGLVVGRPTAVREDPGSNLTATGRVYHDSHCDIHPWARVVHPYCSA